jgi:hypothetical protein
MAAVGLFSLRKEDHSPGERSAKSKIAGETSRCIAGSFKTLKKTRFTWVALILFLPFFQLIGWNMNYRRSMMSLLFTPQSVNFDQPSHLGNGLFRLLDGSYLTTVSAVENQATLPHPIYRRARVLLGIFSNSSDLDTRKAHGTRFGSWKTKAGTRHGMVCPWSDFETQMHLYNSSECELIYLFVIGASQENGADAVGKRLRSPINESARGGFEPNNMTWLNITKYTNHNQVLTWLNYAAQLADAHGIDFVAKCEGNTWLDIDAYFAWADQRLRPAPYNRGMVAGTLHDKVFWKNPPGGDVREVRRTDGFFYANYDAHLYMESKHCICPS